MSKLLILGGSDAGISAALQAGISLLLNHQAQEAAVRPFGGISVIPFRIKKGRGKSDGHNH